MKSHKIVAYRVIWWEIDPLFETSYEVHANYAYQEGAQVRVAFLKYTGHREAFWFPINASGERV